MKPKCLWCGSPIKPVNGKIRPDRKTCSASHRTLLWMARKVSSRKIKLA